MKRKTVKCKTCDSLFEITKLLRHQLGYCSSKCFKSSSEYRERRKAADQKRVSKIDFVAAGKRAKITRARNFLVDSGVDVSMMSDDDIQKEFARRFDGAEHGAKIVAGRLARCGGSAEEYRRSFADALSKSVASRCGISIERFLAQDIETQKELTHAAFSQFKVGDVVSWKRQHAVNLSIADAITMSPDEIRRWYSEYLSSRYKRESLECASNGYTRTEKGWYVFADHSRLFYRSSWERCCMEEADRLIQQGKIRRAFAPSRISYVSPIDNTVRHYYPDLGLEMMDGEQVVIEIKPQKLVSDPVAAAKLSALRDSCSNVLVITEVELRELTSVLLRAKKEKTDERSH